MHSTTRPPALTKHLADAPAPFTSAPPPASTDEPFGMPAPPRTKPSRWVTAASLFSILLFSPLAHSGLLDLSHAVVLRPPNLTGPEQKAVTMLIEEVEKRTTLRWPVATNWADRTAPAVIVAQRSALKGWLGSDSPDLPPIAVPTPPEGFTLWIPSNAPARVFIIGNDARGILFGIGHLLRHLRMDAEQVAVSPDTSISTAPRYPLRGHQLGYRPKTHAYDAWDLSIWEQYIRDLAVFGCNAVELIPPRSDDDATSPHFPLPPARMLTGMSRLLDDYGLDVWLWYPAMDPDYSDPATVQAALKEWGAVFESMPRLDAVFVPGGDPGHTPPKVLMSLLEKETEVLHRSHPKAQMWVSPQSFTQEWLAQFLDLLQHEQPAWLSGVVFGPQSRLSLPKLRAAIPARYPIRHYPDITHCRQCQFPVPDWDAAFAVTIGREGINPRPLGYASIFRLLQPDTIGFISYSEGCNDDVNKTVWSALGWDPDVGVIDVLRQYSRYFVGEHFTDSLAQGLLALERDWQGPLLSNENVSSTLAQFQSMERAASPRDKHNWRFLMGLYRAYYDAYTRTRLIYETGLEDRAMESLRAAEEIGTLAAVDVAERILNRAVRDHVAADLRARIFELAEGLFQTIRMQLSVPRYQAIGVDRGASLDTVDYPLNNRHWLLERFAAIRSIKAEKDRLDAISSILHWTDPGPGGFYDDLGNISRQPHLVVGTGWERDPSFLESSHPGFEEGDVVDEPDEKPEGALRWSWLNHAESLYDAPLEMHYAHLEPGTRYKLRVVYAGDSPKKKIRLEAGSAIEIHPFITKPWPIRPIEFDIPPSAIENYKLNLRWYREPGQGGNGRGCQVSEVWLIKQPETPASPPNR